VDAANHYPLTYYAEFIGVSTDYVRNQAINSVLASDKGPVKARAAGPGTFGAGAC